MLQIGKRNRRFGRFVTTAQINFKGPVFIFLHFCNGF